MNIFIEIDDFELGNQDKMLHWLKEESRLEDYEGNVNWIFMDNEQIAVINKEYLDHEGPTDVISFDFEEDSFDLPEELEEDDIISGEIFVSIERAQEQAEEYNVTLIEEISRLAIHGLLHLAGWDDHSDEEREEMHKRENEGLIRARIDGKFPWSVNYGDNEEERQ